MIEAAQTLAPIIVRIETRDSIGTGFVASHSEDWSRIGIATAYHVIETANRNGGAITIITPGGGTIAVDTQDEEAFQVRSDYDSDSALIVMDYTRDLKLPAGFVAPMLHDEETMRQVLLPGHPVGWMGYPFLLPETQCFFSGSISAYDETNKWHYIDGVAIPGVSGGPVFGIFPPDESLMVVGLISSYHANIRDGQSLPGLSVALSSEIITQFFGY